MPGNKIKSNIFCKRGHRQTKESIYTHNGYVYCSICRNENSRKKLSKEIICEQCGKLKIVFSKKPRFCSVQCAGKSSLGTQAITHNMTYSSEYNIWLSMKSRCLRKSDKNYKMYGAKGISICKEWKLSFECFYKDMGKRPSTNHSLDRINNLGNYEPSNCRWATREIQSMNRGLGSSNKTGYKGVHRIKGRFCARFKNKHLGYFEKPEDAAIAYDKEVYKKYGKTMYLNFKELF